VSKRPQQGASAVEYSLLAALIAGVIVAVVLTLGQDAQSTYRDSCERISTAMGSDC